MATVPPGDRAAEGVGTAGGAAARSLFLGMWRGWGPDGVIKTEPPGRRWASRGRGSAVGTRSLSSRRGTASRRVRCAGLRRPLAAARSAVQLSASLRRCRSCVRTPRWDQGGPSKINSGYLPSSGRLRIDASQAWAGRWGEEVLEFGDENGAS